MKHDFLDNVLLVSRINDAFPEDKVVILQSHLVQFLPLADTQLQRVRDGVALINASPKSIEATIQIVSVMGDVRFFYETLYWIALAVERAAQGNKVKNPDSSFARNFEHNLRGLVIKLRRGRIALSHIHFDQLITAESSDNLKNMKNHLPTQDKLLYSFGLDPKTRLVRIGRTQLSFEDDYKTLRELKQKLVKPEL
jgi:hypothetical protein